MNQFGRIHVKHLREEIYDIFWGFGWDNWSRVQIRPTDKNPYTHLKGFSLPFQAKLATNRYLRIN